LLRPSLFFFPIANEERSFLFFQRLDEAIFNLQGVLDPNKISGVGTGQIAFKLS
jgi:hypothetical protein